MVRMIGKTSPLVSACALAVGALTLAFGASAQSAPGPQRTQLQRTQLQRGRALWDSLHLRNYTFRIRFGGFPVPGGYPFVTVTVRNGRASVAHPQQVDQGNNGLALDTVPNLFREIRHVLADPQAGGVTIRYDRRRGFPASALIDPIKLAIDDEFSWTIDRFRVLPPGHG